MHATETVHLPKKLRIIKKTLEITKKNDNLYFIIWLVDF